LLNANARWNILSGATRSGKTFITYDLIARRVAEQPAGNCILIGKTLGTLDYNVLEPMRERFGKAVKEMSRTASGIFKTNIFGRDFRCVGANDKASVRKIHGSKIVYAYGDEVATWDESVFNMLKSRLDTKEAKFDGTTNPDVPKHWLKVFMDNGRLNSNIWNFKIDDNSFLDEEFVEDLKMEYEGTVLYDRYILGLWRAAEGAVYKPFGAREDDHIIDEAPDDIHFVVIGVDFGGNKSGHAFNATAYRRNWRGIVTIDEFWDDTIYEPKDLYNAFIDWITPIHKKYKILEVRADSEATTLKNGLQTALTKAKMSIVVENAVKGKITDRVAFYNSMFSLGGYKILKSCEHTINAFRDAVWKDNRGVKDERLDDGTTNIDTLDAQEYSTEDFHEELIGAMRRYERI